MVSKMVETKLLTRFLQSGESVATAMELRDDIIIEELERKVEKTTQTLLDQFFQTIDKNTEILNPEVVIPTFFLGKLLQQIPLGKTNPLRKLRDTVSNHLDEYNLEAARIVLQSAGRSPKKNELVSSILQTIRTILETR